MFKNKKVKSAMPLGQERSRDKKKENDCRSQVPFYAFSGEFVSNRYDLRDTWTSAWST